MSGCLESRATAILTLVAGLVVSGQPVGACFASMDGRAAKPLGFACCDSGFIIIDGRQGHGGSVEDACTGLVDGRAAKPLGHAPHFRKVDECDWGGGVVRKCGARPGFRLLR